MGSLAPIALDIETSGLEPGAVITVAGLAFELGQVVILNSSGQPVNGPLFESYKDIDHLVVPENIH